MRKFLYSLILPILLLSVNSCLTEEYDSENYLTPTVRCTKVEPISGSTGIVFSGEFENKSPRSVVVGSGFYYSLGSDFSSAVKVSSSAANGNVFTCELLLPEYEANYSVKAYISDGRHELLSDAVKYKTASFDSHVTLAVSSISADSDKHAAEITSIVSFDTGVALTERGVCYGTAPNPALSSDNISMASGTGSGKFFVTLSSLKEGCNYYVRSYVKSGEYIAYSEQQSFNTAVNVTGVSVTPTSLTLTEGERSTLSATVSPSNATDKTVIWKSSDETVAVVAFGMVTAKKTGECTITASTSNGEFSDTCAVTVTCPVQGINLDEHSVTLDKGSSFQLNAIVSPDRATNKAVKWESSDKDVAIVDASGKVTGVNVGNAEITAISEDNESLFSSCKVNVVSPVSSISISPEQIDIYENDSQQLELTFEPGDASNKEVNWTCRDTDIANVDDKGNVKGIKAGKTEVYAASKDGGNMAFCRVSVYSHVKSIDLYFNGTKIDDGSEIKAFKGESVEVEAVLQPKETILNKKVTWKSSNTKVLRDKGEGKFEAISSGTAVLTVTAADGGINASCKVVVTNPAREISLNKTQLNLTKGSTAILTATVVPADADDKRVVWFSSVETVATVDQSGKVVAKKSGIADITVKSVAVPFFVCTSCQVTVTTPVESVQLDSQTVLEISKTKQLTATILPEDADNKNIKWTSSDPEVVSVTNGLLTGLKIGSARVFATSDGDPTKKAWCDVTIVAERKLVTSVSLNQTSKQLNKEETFQLTATILPADATDKTLKWVSSNANVVSVNGDGLVTAVDEGSATVTATANDGSGKYATCKINVVSSQTEINGNTNEQVGENEGTW